MELAMAEAEVLAAEQAAEEVLAVEQAAVAGPVENGKKNKNVIKKGKYEQNLDDSLCLSCISFDTIWLV
jgi:hypothetical protein